MVYVRLAKEWTDGQGVSHGVGAVLQVEESVAADLQARGMVSWVGPTAPPEGGQGVAAGWLGPTGTTV